MLVSKFFSRGGPLSAVQKCRLFLMHVLLMVQLVENGLTVSLSIQVRSIGIIQGVEKEILIVTPEWNGRRA